MSETDELRELAFLSGRLHDLLNSMLDGKKDRPASPHSEDVVALKVAAGRLGLSPRTVFRYAVRDGAVVWPKGRRRHVDMRKISLKEPPRP